jgi:hypothetical protein
MRASRSVTRNILCLRGVAYNGGHRRLKGTEETIQVSGLKGRMCISVYEETGVGYLPRTKGPEPLGADRLRFATVAMWYRPDNRVWRPMLKEQTGDCLG